MIVDLLLAFKNMFGYQGLLVFALIGYSVTAITLGLGFGAALFILKNALEKLTGRS